MLSKITLNAKLETSSFDGENTSWECLKNSTVRRKKEKEKVLFCFS